MAKAIDDTPATETVPATPTPEQEIANLREENAALANEVERLKASLPKPSTWPKKVRVVVPGTNHEPFEVEAQSHADAIEKFKKARGIWTLPAAEVQEHW